MLSRKTDSMGFNYGVATWSLIIQSVCLSVVLLQSLGKFHKTLMLIRPHG